MNWWAEEGEMNMQGEMVLAAEQVGESVRTLRRPTSVRAQRRPTSVAHQQGFSLIEMLLVLGIIAFIATMLATNIFGNQQRANVRAAQAAVRKVATNVDQFYLDTGTLPAKIEDLVTRVPRVPPIGTVRT